MERTVPNAVGNRTPSDATGSRGIQGRDSIAARVRFATEPNRFPGSGERRPVRAGLDRDHPRRSRRGENESHRQNRLPRIDRIHPKNPDGSSSVVGVAPAVSPSVSVSAFALRSALSESVTTLEVVLV